MSRAAPLMKPEHIVVLCAICWLVFLILPRTVLVVGLLVYIAIPILLAWSAIRYRSKGWIWGLLLALLLITFPHWVIVIYRLFELISGNSLDTIPYWL